VTTALDEVLSQRRRVAGVRHQLATSRLLRGGGMLRTRIAARAELAALSADSLRSHADAVEARVEAPSSDERGDPDRWLESAPGGSALDAFAGAPDMLGLLRRATGVTWQPAGPGTWSYYRREGHHLGVHRDLAVCDLAVITCVRDEGGGASSGVLRLWPTRARESLNALRDDDRGGIDVHLEAGDTILLLGGVVPHRVLPLAAGHVRIVAPLCFRVSSPGPSGSP